MRRRDAELQRLAARQHGVATRAQLVELGFSARTIDRRVAAGAFRRLHRGIYLVGAVPPPLAGELAAVLACGDGAFLSHGSAANLWGLLLHKPRPQTPEVTVVGRDPRPAGIRVHRARTLAPIETTAMKRVPITTPARTVLDVAPGLEPHDAERALAEAIRRRLFRPEALADLLARYPGRPGTPLLRGLLDQDGGPAFSRSALEQRFLALVREAGLPAPQVNEPLGPYEIDFLWREHRLALEADSWTWHADRKAFEDDRRRDADLVARGYRVIRVTWHQIAETPIAVVARLAAALAVPG